MSSLTAFPTLADIHQQLRAGTASLPELIEFTLARIALDCPREVFISRVDPSELRRKARQLHERLAADAGLLERLPLLGIPFVVKDNIDVAGMDTTCACPAFAYRPEHSAAVVDRLEAAGAILIGKTNLDQFATGLVGIRSPYGEVSNPFQSDYVSGGSSSGSAAAVALGLVPFALGTDTAGSGRVPAGFCNLVGMKPTPGLISTRGVFPACKSLDCVSILSHTVADAWTVASVLAGIDPQDVYTRHIDALPPIVRTARVGLPTPLDFLGDQAAQSAFDRALDILRQNAQFEFVEIPFEPFDQIAQLLYDGPWVAERRLAIGDFFRERGGQMDPTVHEIIGKADGKSAIDTFKALYRLEAGKRMAEAVFTQVDCLLVPTAPTIHKRATVAADPIARNSDFGLYTNFVNLLGMSALALPGPFRSDGLPAGITLIAPGGGDHRLAELGRRIEPLLHQRLGLSLAPPPRMMQALPPLPDTTPSVRLAVVGAHLSGMPLNWQLQERCGRLLGQTRTAAQYRLFALPGTEPRKPGLVRAASGGAAIEVEVWELPATHFGSFVASIPAPLGIGTLTLQDGSEVQGFLCEAAAALDAEDITHFGGWRAYRANAQHHARSQGDRS